MINGWGRWMIYVCLFDYVFIDMKSCHFNWRCFVCLLSQFKRIVFFYCDNKSFIHVFPARRKGEVRARNTLQNMFVWQLIIWCSWHRKPFVLFYSRRKNNRNLLSLVKLRVGNEFIIGRCHNVFLKFTARTEEMQA